jgi:hypothetical protein
LPKAYPSKLAALAAFKKVKVKTEKVDTDAKTVSLFSSTFPRTISTRTVSEDNYEAENELIPKSAFDRQIVGQLCFMGFNDVREVMRALRAVQINAKEESNSLSGLVEETIAYIEVSQILHNMSFLSILFY